ncbi:RNA-binding cell elongation regulator Jag/EloR [uncultured Oscillibacter sp.]|uniref:RNA-binding cell elongation regulator Jag/EloR n=1 Tax=uncultured Oscillibacter sp. TaxID=876091 RepID=UPI0025E0E448|nr:RNA-binding cell elongation regulator Jag/EloR [uncultured Oscillibacter sp.]
MSYIDVTGKTEEEAIARGLSQLNMERDDVSVEILERAKSGFLGIGSAPAKVRVTYGGEEEKPAAPEFIPAKPKAESRPAAKPAAKPAVKPAPRVEKPTEEPVQKTREPAVKEERPAPAQYVSKPLGEEVQDEKAEAIRTFLSGLLEKMEVESQIRVYQPEKGRYQVILEGSGMGQIIGRRGETLDAIQQLTGYCVNRAGTGRVRVAVDAENYRAKREESLDHLARKVAAKVVKYRRSVTLEPMNAYERHIIHAALQDEPNVATGSIGSDPNRRVVVSYVR